MAKSTNQRKTEQRKRDRALGIVERIIIVHEDDVQRVRAFAESLMKQRGF